MAGDGYDECSGAIALRTLLGDLADDHAARARLTYAQMKAMFRPSFLPLPFLALHGTRSARRKFTPANYVVVGAVVLHADVAW